MTPEIPPRGRPTNFLWIERDLIDRGVIGLVGPSAWAIYTVLARHADQAGYAYPSQLRIQQLANLSNKTVVEGVKILVRFDLIKKVGMGRSRNAYHLLPASICIRNHLSEGPTQLADGSSVKTTPRHMKKLHPKKSQEKESQGKRKDAPPPRSRPRTDDQSRGAALFFSPEWGVMNSAAPGGSSGRERSFALLCTYLGGDTNVRRLIDDSSLPIDRRKWLRLREKTIRRIYLEAQEKTSSDQTGQHTETIRLLDEHIR